MTEPNDIIDAEFVTIADSGSTKPASAAASRPDPSASDSQLGLFRENARENASLREELIGGERMSLPVFTAVALLLSAVAFLGAGGYTLFLPPSAPAAIAATPAETTPPVPSDPLVVDGLHLSHSNRGGHFILTVRARIKNTGEKALSVPPLVISFADASGASKRYLIPRGESLAAGEQMAFTSHLPVETIPSSDPTISFDR